MYIKVSKKIKWAMVLSLNTILLLTTSCNDDYLTEKPKSFLAPENVFVDKQGFESALAHMYLLSREYATGNSWVPVLAMPSLYGYGTDIATYVDQVNYFADYSLINPFNATASGFWQMSYQLIKESNAVLSRSENEDIIWDSETDKEQIQAEARFFRAFAYRYLVYLYGDVPIVREEILGPKFDYTRNPKDEVLNFMVDDLEFASANLPKQNPGNGKLSSAAADHLLTETYISLKEYDNAIAAASRVIDDPQYQLMTSRFGAYTGMDGDVFWDLFRIGNQNRTSGNTESIWVWQIEFNVPGGSANPLERSWGPYLESLKDPDGKQALLRDDALGRSVGWVRPTVYLEYTIWNGNWDNDIRNSEYNMQREFINNNPASAYFGQVIDPAPSDTLRNHFVRIIKAFHPEGHPQDYDRNGRLYSDIYAMRLAETFLLRAEAYLGKGDVGKAAEDINKVRARAKANPVSEAEVNIDYILDERARELVIEEPRRLTLARLNLLYERVREYNPVSAPTIKKFHNLWPIPQEEIDANSEATLRQNEGY